VHGLQQAHNRIYGKMAAIKLLTFLCNKGSISRVIFSAGFYFFCKFYFDWEVTKKIILFINQ
jgi:hypothetical protein